MDVPEKHSSASQRSSQLQGKGGSGAERLIAGFQDGRELPNEAFTWYMLIEFYGCPTQSTDRKIEWDKGIASRVSGRTMLSEWWN